MKYLLIIALFASTTFGINLSGQVTPNDTQFATLGSHVYVVLVDADTVAPIQTAHPNAFGYYSFSNVTSNHNYFLIPYSGKIADGYGLDFNPVLRPLTVSTNDADSLDFTWSPFSDCIVESPC